MRVKSKKSSELDLGGGETCSHLKLSLSLSYDTLCNLTFMCRVPLIVNKDVSNIFRHEGHEAFASRPSLRQPNSRPPVSAAGCRYRGEQLQGLPLQSSGGGLGAVSPGGALLQ